MRNYDRVHLRKPEGIEERKAYIVGGGIAGLSAAAFLVRDAQMPGKNITVYDQLPVFGGSMDCAGASETGYVSRGERELEPYMECLWDLFGSIPSLYEEGRTVLDETRECNKNWEIDSKHRLWKQGFRPHDESTMGVTLEIQEQVIKMMLTEEDQLERDHRAVVQPRLFPEPAVVRLELYAVLPALSQPDRNAPLCRALHAPAPPHPQPAGHPAHQI